MEVSGWVNPPYAESGEEPDRERIMETRLVLSDDIGPVNVAFNWINETDVTNGHTPFGYSLGLMWMPQHNEAQNPSNHHLSGPGGKTGAEACRCGAEMAGCKCSHCAGHGGECPCAHSGMLGFGVELFGGLGDTKAFSIDPSRQEHYLGPIFMYHINSHWMFHAQLAIGLTMMSDQLTRLNFGYEF
jgi:hypothetical protein